MEDARALDELANDLTANHVLDYYALRSSRVHPIIQRGRAARAGQRGKPAAERWRRIRDHFAHQHVRTLRAAPEAALPRQLRAIARPVGIQRRSEHLVESRGAAAITTFGASADNDLETTWRGHLGPRVPAYLVVDQRILDRSGEAVLRARVSRHLT